MIKFLSPLSLLLQAVFVYALAAWLGSTVNTAHELKLFDLLIVNASLIIYKIGHLPLSAAAGLVTQYVLCQHTNCGQSLTERERDLLTFAMFAVVFSGLCAAR